ncbi:MAG: amidohydrolase family protein [Actinomycetota bacterium]
MSEQSFAVVGAAALMGEQLRAEDDVVVVVSGRRIAAVGPRATTPIPEGAEVVEADGLLVLPGFIDAHVHIGFADPAEVVARGVTCARDLGWPRDEMHRMIQLSRGRDYVGPKLLWAGPMLTAPGGYPTRAAWAPAGTGHEVGSPDEARHAVDELTRGGVDWIKVALNPAVGPSLDHWSLRALVDAAHGQERRVTAHIHGLEELKKALDAGVDEMAHMLMSPEEIPRAVIDRMVEAGMTVVPTLSVFFGAGRAIAVDNLARFIDAGGRVVYGTDLGNEGPEPGIDAREIDGLVEAGMSPLDIVAAATIGAARWLGLDDRGRIEEGFTADLVAVPRDALDDATRLTDVRLVVREGNRVPTRA